MESESGQSVAVQPWGCTGIQEEYWEKKEKNQKEKEQEGRRGGYTCPHRTLLLRS
jgi:hypothetical protein